MKKLNRKGFTLIELLAVVVILAIIVVVTVPTVLKSINDARLSTIHSLSKEVASWYDNSAAQDLIAIGDEKILYGADINTTWQCLDEVKTTSFGDGTPGAQKSLAELYNLSGNEVVLKNGSTSITATFTDVPTQNTCSAIRKNSTTGAAEVLLVATTTGKFYVSGVTYAFSYETNGKTTS